MSYWRKVLNLLNKREVTEKTYEKYVEKAKHYSHCATGELREALESVGYKFDNDTNHPKDIAILTLSKAFYQALRFHKIKEATTIYNSLVILSKGVPRVY